MENEKIREIIKDHLDEIKKSILCFSDSEAFSYKVVIRIWLNENKILIEKVSADSSYVDRSADKTIELSCANLYDYVDDPNSYTDEENIDSFLNSYAIEDEILDDIDEQLNEVD
jgi:hypothetical protein